jgi:uncharacterized protein (TIGR03083 family)
MKRPEPIIVIDLFPEILTQLLDLLPSLSPPDWDEPTACAGWSVKDVALHLLGVDIGNLSRMRDGFSGPESIRGWDELVRFVNAWNEEWVRVARRMSPRLLVDLLAVTGAQVCAYFQSLDPFVIGGSVSWAGPDPAPVWLDLAREYTERWHHQQHIRDAVNRPGLKEPRYLAPVIDAFVRALPRTFARTDAPEGAGVLLDVTGPSGGEWFLRREAGAWTLYLGVPSAARASVYVDQEIAWRLFTKGLTAAEALKHVTIRGDEALGLRVLQTVSIIA